MASTYNSSVWSGPVPFELCLPFFFYILTPQDIKNDLYSNKEDQVLCTERNDIISSILLFSLKLKVKISIIMFTIFGFCQMLSVSQVLDE